MKHGLRLGKVANGLRLGDLLRRGIKWGDIPADRLTPEGLEWLLAILAEHEKRDIALTPDCLCPEEDGEHDDDCPFAHPIVEVQQFSSVFESGEWVRVEDPDGQEVELHIEGFGPWSVSLDDALGVGWPTWETWCTQSWVDDAEALIFMVEGKA